MRKTKPSPNQFDIAIGVRLRTFRVARKLSQSDVGKALGVTFQQIQKYERGANRVAGSRLIQLCEYLKVAPHQLLGSNAAPLDAGNNPLEALRDKNVVRAFIAINKLTPHRRAVVASALINLVEAFG